MQEVLLCVAVKEDPTKHHKGSCLHPQTVGLYSCLSLGTEDTLSKAASFGDGVVAWSGKASALLALA